MKGNMRCVEGRLYRHDPQPDDPDLETDRGVCPECDGAGCEPSAVIGISPCGVNGREFIVLFTKPLTKEEMRGFNAHCKSW